MEDKLVTLAIHTFEKAQILKTILETEGIEVYIHNVNQIQPSFRQECVCVLRRVIYRMLYALLKTISGLRNQRRKRRRLMRSRKF